MTKEPTPKARLLHYASELELWHSPDGETFATILIDDHNENWPLRSHKLKDWLINRYNIETQKSPSSQAISEVLSVLNARASMNSPIHTPALRTAHSKDAVWVDLCNDKWQAVCITANEWRVVDNPDVKFIRRGLMEPLPVPRPGGSIDDLRHFVNSSDQHFTLFVCWLIVALWGRARNYPVLIINGEQGSGKSNLMRLGQSLTDPSKGRALSFDMEGFDLPTLAGSLHVLAFDNVSGLDARKSDLLCRISTGAGIVRRRLYTDNEPTFFEGSRAVTINGIPDLVGRPDLAERSLIMELHAIDSKNRRPEEEWWAEWEFARPFVLGALCDALSCAMRTIANIELDDLPRMADFAKLSVAVEKHFGWDDGAFLAAYETNQQEAAEAIMEIDSVASALKSFVEEKHTQHGWQGTATELLAELNTHIGNDSWKDPTWPKKPSALGNRVKRARKLLSRKGIYISRRHTGEQRQITVRTARQT